MTGTFVAFGEDHFQSIGESGPLQGRKRQGGHAANFRQLASIGAPFLGVIFRKRLHVQTNTPSTAGTAALRTSAAVASRSQFNVVL